MFDHVCVAGKGEYWFRMSAWTRAPRFPRIHDDFDSRGLDDQTPKFIVCCYRFQCQPGHRDMQGPFGGNICVVLLRIGARWLLATKTRHQQTNGYTLCFCDQNWGECKHWAIVIRWHLSITCHTLFIILSQYVMICTWYTASVNKNHGWKLVSYRWHWEVPKLSWCQHSGCVALVNVPGMHMCSLWSDTPRLTAPCRTIFGTEPISLHQFQHEPNTVLTCIDIVMVCSNMSNLMVTSP